MRDMQKRCFVVGAIGEPGSRERNHADWLLQGIIEPTFSQNFPHYQVSRSDKIAAPGMIDSQIINALMDVELVIADMTWLNANAFYEMGIRHMAQKPTIHMFRVGESIPFDVKPYRAIEFSLEHPSELERARATLHGAVAETEKKGFQIENPVTRARGLFNVEQDATSDTKIILSELSDLRDRVYILEGTETRHTRVAANEPGRHRFF